MCKGSEYYDFIYLDGNGNWNTALNLKFIAAHRYCRAIEKLKNPFGDINEMLKYLNDIKYLNDTSKRLELSSEKINFLKDNLDTLY